MTDTTALRDLLGKVKSGGPITFEDFAPVFTKNAADRLDASAACRGNANAAIALCKSVVPEWHWGMDDVGANVYLGAAHRPKAIFSAKGEPARALLICTIEAMIWRAENG